MLAIVEVAEAGIRALAFWVYLFSPKYRTQLHQEWRESSQGHRAMLLFEGLISVALGLGGPVILWQMLT